MSKTVSAPALAAAALEKSTPIYLVEIALDSGTKYFAQNNAAVVFPTSGGQTYNAWEYTFNRVRSTLTNEIDRVTTFAFDNTSLAFSGYLTIEEFQGRAVTLKRVYSSLLDSAADATTIFYGEIGELTIDESVFQFVAVSPLIRLNLQIPRRMFQPGCSWVFDSTECRGYNVAGAVAGTTLAAASTGVVESGSTAIQIKDVAHRVEAADYWRKGRVTFTSGALNGRAAEITSSTAAGLLNLMVPLPSAPAAGVTYSIKRGCNKTPADCIKKFNNYHNFGGFTAIPEKEI